MEDQKKKCHYIGHLEIDAITYCNECKIYMCKECNNIHSKRSPEHKTFNVNKDNLINSFILCNENNHGMQLKYFCKDHNQLCCEACKENGKHKVCDICSINKIKFAKKKIFENNIDMLEKTLKDIPQKNIKLKNVFEDIKKNKNELKLEINNIFLKIREIIDDKEKALLNELETQFEKLSFKKDILSENEQLTDKIKTILKKTDKIFEEFHDDVLLFIKDCIEIEEDIKKINIIDKNIEKCEKWDKEIIKFIPEEKDINIFLDDLKSFLDEKLKIKTKTEMDKYQNLIEKMRKEFNLDKEQYTDEIIFESLKNEDFDIVQAFESCIQKLYDKK